MTTDVIYYNKNTGSFSNFELQTLRPLQHYKYQSLSLDKIANLYIEDAIKEISLYGKELEFPKLLLEELTDAEVDMLLVLSYNTQVKKAVEECLFMPLPYEISQLYKDIQSGEYLNLEAIGKYSVITSKDKDDDIVAVNIGFEELDSRFIKYQGI